MKLKIHHSKPAISGADIKAVSRILKTRHIASGKAARDFEEGLAKLLKVRNVIAVNSGTSALHLALLALKIKQNDEVIVPSFTCASLLNAVLYTGAKPKIADIDPIDFNLDLKDTKRKISRNTKAIILPHMFGKPANVDLFLKLGIPIIENCAQSLGARYKGKMTSALGAMSIFSFYATKIITTGYGGMVCSKNKVFIRRIKDLIEVDERPDYKKRFNYKMSDISASLGISQLKSLKGFISKRQELAKFYNKALGSRDILLPEDKEKNHIYYRYVIMAPGNIDRIIYGMNKKGIEVKRPVFKPLHRYLNLNKKDFPNTEAVYNSAISLPIYPALKKSEAKYIVDNLKLMTND